jgi:hypothetical protein
MASKKRQVKTEWRYAGMGQWSHHKGPIENVKHDPELRTMHAKPYVNVKRYNDIVLHRKLREASYVGAPILRRKPRPFTNNPVIS